MPSTHPPYAPEYRRRIIELARAGRSINEQCCMQRIRDRVRAILDRLEGRDTCDFVTVLQLSCRSRCWPSCLACHRRIEANSSNGPMR
jgi:hypothetical protein